MGVKNKKAKAITLLGGAVVILILLFGTIWSGQRARQDTEDAVRSVSLLYLDELAGRREQVVSQNLQNRIRDMKTALDLMTEEDLSDKVHLEAYQAKMKRLFTLERFAFVNSDGLIYTSTGIQTDIDDYPFDYQTLSGSDIFILNPKSEDKKVIIALPVNFSFQGETLVACFMQLDMDELLSGLSLQSQTEGTTFCNIYTNDGIALSNTVLGGLAVEDNLLAAMETADYDSGYSYSALLDDFSKQRAGVVSFTYNGIRETLSYVPVSGTDWMLTYLIRESVISEKIGSVTTGIIQRSIFQSVITALVLMAVFSYLLRQDRKNASLQLEKETSEAENRVKQQELEQRIALQEQLLLEERQREQQEKMITALAADYWSVYYLELDKDTGICFQSHSDLDDGFKVGERFPYLASVTAYANRYITDAYRDGFLRFIQPASVIEGLKEHRVISYTYTVNRHGTESYEMVKFAGVRHLGTNDDYEIHNVGACFTNVDLETRKNIAQQEALSEALVEAEQANKAKTIFLSNMSHEIRTPMNAIIGLDNIALNDPDLPPRTREQLEKIGSSAEHLLNLINDILDMSRIESGRMTLKNEEFSFPKLLEAINTMFSGQCQDKGLDYQCHIGSDIDIYYIGDNMKLRQVLINILGNAVKFTPSGGKIDFTADRIAHYDKLSTLRFIISDTGIGMSEDFLLHIFDTFAQEDSSSTNKYGSSGLGLAITKNIVEMMNGHIDVESIKGKGTTFTVTVTLTNSDRSDMDSSSDEIHPEEMTVLIVDDDPIACEHAKLVLGKAGIAAEIAACGAEAIEMVSLRHARREPYNLILVDWHMPEMDGVETTRQIRAIVGNESAIIILTAYRWDDVLEEALEAGVDSFLPKPLFAAAVLDEFKSALKRKNIFADSEKSRVDLTGRRILLAEDIQVNAEIMTMVLQMREIEADVAENGKIAVEMFASHPAGYYDAILMDMRMPEMDGLEATRRIRSMERQDAAAIPIIALTANAFDEDVQRSLQAGLNAHLSKPVQPESLFETLESLIRS